MKAFLIGIVFITFFFSSCNEKKKSAGQDEGRTMLYIVNHPDDVDKNGKGTYINTNSEKTCPHCGMRVSRDNIFHDCQNKNQIGNGSRSRGGNQYGKGYEQGQEDARNGLDPNPEGYGGNGQFEKGYEDGYEDW